MAVDQDRLFEVGTPAPVRMHVEREANNKYKVFRAENLIGTLEYRPRPGHWYCAIVHGRQAGKSTAVSSRTAGLLALGRAGRTPLDTARVVRVTEQSQSNTMLYSVNGTRFLAVEGKRGAYVVPMDELWLSETMLRVTEKVRQRAQKEFEESKWDSDE